MGKVFVSDAITEDALSELKQHLDVHVETGLSEAELCEKMKGFDALMVRSATTVTKAVSDSSSMKT